MDEITLQNKARDLVHEHVYVCQSSLVDEMLRQAVFEYEDIEGLSQFKDEADLRYEYDDDWEAYSDATNETLENFIDYVALQETEFDRTAIDDETELKEAYPERWGEWEEILTTRLNIDVCRESIDSFEGYLEHVVGVDEDELKEGGEIFEWWAISDWLVARLRAYGNAFLVNDYGSWWGRQTSGQAISMDEDIRQIVKDWEEKYGSKASNN